MLTCAVQVMRWRDTRTNRPVICKDTLHTLCEQPLQTEASTTLDLSLSHTYAHSVIRRFFYIPGDCSPDKYGSVESKVLHLSILVAQQGSNPDLCTTRPACLTTLSRLQLFPEHKSPSYNGVIKTNGKN